MAPAFLNFEKFGNNLWISLTDEGRDELPNLIKRFGPSGEDILIGLMGHQLCNGWDRVRPEEVGALTDSLIITDSAERDDEGELTGVGRTYWHPNYMVENPIDSLQNDGVFVMVGQDD